MTFFPPLRSGKTDPTIVHASVGQKTSGQTTACKPPRVAPLLAVHVERVGGEDERVELTAGGLPADRHDIVLVEAE